MVFNPCDETPTWRARTEIALNLSPISIDISGKAGLDMNPLALLWALGVTETLKFYDQNKNGNPMAWGAISAGMNCLTQLEQFYL